MRPIDYINAFKKNLRKNPKYEDLPDVAELSRRSALGESWAKLALEAESIPRIVSQNVQRYRRANMDSPSVLADITMEKERGIDALTLAARAGWGTPRDRDADGFMKEYLRLMDAKEAGGAQPKKESTKGKSKKKASGRKVGRPKKKLSESAYEEFCSGEKTIEEIAAENSMTVKTATKRIKDIAGPDITDIQTLVRKAEVQDPEKADERIEEIIETLQDIAEEPEEDISPPVMPNGYADRDEILQYIFDPEVKRADVLEVYDVTEEDIEVLLRLDFEEARQVALDHALAEASKVIVQRAEEAVSQIEEEEEASSTPSEIATVQETFKYFEPKKKGRRKKSYTFSEDEVDFILRSWVEDEYTAKWIAERLTEDRGEKVTQTAVKDVIAKNTPKPKRGRKSTLDRAALERDARRNLAVPTLAEMYNVSTTTIANALRDMDIQPIYSLAKEARLRKLSDEERAESKKRLAATDLEVLTMLNDANRRTAIKTMYLASNLPAENDLAVVAAENGVSNLTMLRVLKDIFEDEIRRLRDRDRVDELVSQYGADQLRKIQRDLIDERTLRLRGNPFDDTALNMYVVPGAQGAAAGLVVDQALRHFYPEASPNKRNLTSGAIVASVCAADYMYQKDEKKLWRAAGGVAGVLISRFIESKFQTKG